MKSGLSEHRQELIEMLLDALKGRTWKGKEKLLQALANLCRFNAETEKVSSELLEQVVESVMKECNKQDVVYKRFSLSALGDILEVLKIDRFEQVYNTLSDTLAKVLIIGINDRSLLYNFYINFVFNPPGCR